MKLPNILDKLVQKIDLSALFLILIFLSLFLGWVKSPIQNKIRGIDLFILSGDLLNIPWLGIVIIIFAILIPFFYFSNHPLLKGITGLIPLWIASIFFIKMTFFNNVMLDRLIEQNSQYVEMIKFSYRFLPLNFGIEPTVSRSLSAESFLSRIYAAWYFLSWGWYLFVIGGIMFSIYTFIRLQSKKISDGYFLIAPVLFAFSIIMSITPAITCQYLIEKGDKYFSNGSYDAAMITYNKARKIYPPIERGDYFNQKIGRVYYILNIKYQPENYIYEGDLYMKQKRLDDAEFAYNMALKIAEGHAREQAKSRLGWLYINKGLKYYKMEAIGSAVLSWNNALEVDHGQTQAHYYLSKGYYDLGQYEVAILENQRLLSKSVNPILNANVYANIGDCYYKLHDYLKAREYYQASIKLDRYNNFRIFKSLSGTGT